MSTFGIVLYVIAMIAIPAFGCSMTEGPVTKTAGYSYVVVSATIAIICGLLIWYGPESADDSAQAFLIIAVVGIMPFAGLCFATPMLVERAHDVFAVIRRYSS